MASERRPTLLLVVHSWGGGVIHYARLLRDQVASRVNVVFAWGVEDRWLHVSTRDPESPDQSFDLADGLDAPLATLRALEVRRVDLLCAIGLQAHLGTLLDRLAVPFDVTFQAYELLADNNTHLLGPDGHYLGERAVSALARSIERSQPVEHVLRTADRRIACSRDLAWRASRLLPGYPILPVRPPEPGAPHKVVPTLPILRADEPLRVLVLGRIAPHKGLGVIREVARIADAKSFPIEIMCLGEPQVPPSDLPASPRVRILGHYDVDALKTVVPPLRPHLAWLPFVWPETHSFVLSEAMALGLPVLATGIGAVPERVEGRPATWLLPLDQASPQNFFRWFERLARERLATPPQWMPTRHLPPLVPNFYERDYLAPLCGRGPARAGPGAGPLRRVHDGYKTIRRLLGPSRKGIPGTDPKIDAIAPHARPVSPRPKAPDATAWDELAGGARAPRRPPVVDVIVPVYRGHDDTLACLHSVLASRNVTAYELVVIDDASPEPDLAAALDAIAARGLIDLVRNPANQGFVRSVNSGMARHPDRDAILLNSDTIVHDGWIDRLRAHRLGTRRIGTITPWSNNATLLSYPVTFESNDVDLEIDFAALDRLAASELAGKDCDLPTGVGFCLYVSRDCLDDVGAFNADAFGRGYGEENDFCLRAAARGWRNIAACDVFVRHTGEVSFRTDAVEARRRAGAALLALHPRYMELIAAFMREDPLRPYRERLDLARLRRWGEGRLVVRFGDDGSGGDAPIEDAARVVHLCPSQDDAEAFVMRPVADLVLPNLPRLPIGDAEAAVRLLFGLGAVGAQMKASTGLTANQARFAREICAKLRQAR
jgi:GT2 family glycosyltransferase/glycosyltransferase involved in cell wall biosynthesis